MTKQTLIRSRRIAHLQFASRVEGGATSAIFAQGEDSDLMFALDGDSWREMGEPHTITLDITPGDLLNEE